MKRLFYVLLMAGISGPVFAQQALPILRVSPAASVSQNIATFANVSISYHRPAVNGREVWGELVPFGLAPNNFGNGNPMPWRAGANETTVITFSHDVKIEGQDLKAGSYGLHMIPAENDVTIIFNTNSQSWGSFFYEKELDALRVKVPWQDAAHQENLIYAFENLTANSTNAYLHWGNKKIAFNIEVDRIDIILNAYRSSLTNRPGFNQAAFTAAANFCIDNNVNLEEAEAWIEKALGTFGGQNFNNLSAKARILALKGDEKASQEILDQAIQNGTEAELNIYGYQLLGQNPSRIDEALKIFKINIERFPESWNAYDSYAEALNSKGDIKNALKYYDMALQKAPEAQKARIEGIINSL